MTCISPEYAKREDLPRIFELCLQRACESNYQECAPIDEYQIKQYIARAFEAAPCIVIRDDEGAIVSFAGLCVDSHWWSCAPSLQFYMVYVSPDNRGGGHVQALHKCAQEFADMRGWPLFDAYIATDRHGARIRQMESMGYENTGMQFRYTGGK